MDSTPTAHSDASSTHAHPRTERLSKGCSVAQTTGAFKSVRSRTASNYKGQGFPLLCSRNPLRFSAHRYLSTLQAIVPFVDILNALGSITSWVGVPRGMGKNPASHFACLSHPKPAFSIITTIDGSHQAVTMTSISRYRCSCRRLLLPSFWVGELAKDFLEKLESLLPVAVLARSFRLGSRGAGDGSPAEPVARLEAVDHEVNLGVSTITEQSKRSWKLIALWLQGLLVANGASHHIVTNIFESGLSSL